ncbi:MAG: hypothetical protein GY756_18250 [bacterium]|nr:hypothetical protein [bacterium]
MIMKYPKGAEWRKWDLHTHTPGTAKNDQFSSLHDVWEEYIKRIEDLSEIKVIGITDYFSIENYLKVKEIQDSGRLQGKIILPNVELRILPVTGSNTPINLHIIFDPKLNKNIIEREFFRKLKFPYQGADYSCIRTDLVELGRAYKSDIFLEESAALKEGVGQFNIPFSDLKNIFKENVLADKCLIGVSNSNNDGNSGIQHSSLAATRQEIYRFSDFIFSANPNDTTYFLGKGCDSSEKVIKDYGSLKPCFTGSDAHSFDEVLVFKNERYTWFKADPTFEGLMQVINEPEERVFIGTKPPLLDRVTTHRTKYIKELLIKHVDGYDGSQGIWFENVKTPLNQELVAIIGNKGSGKSAIADIISLCANYHNDKDFSFLTSKKFREKSGKIAKNFNGILTWESGIQDNKNLNDIPESTEVLTVKYLPQGTFERLTNEINTVDSFQKEIESVVFSHIPESEKLETKSFNELIEKKSFTVESEIAVLINDINNINKEIIEIERKSTPSYKTEIQNKISKKEEELKALIEPEKVSDPNEDPEKKKHSETANKKIEIIKTKVDEIERQISTTISQKKELFTTIQKLSSIKSEALQKESEINRFKIEKSEELLEFEIDIDKFITLKIDFSEINTVISSKEKELNKIKLLLGETECINESKTLYEQLQEKEDAHKAETLKLNTEQKRYQDYLTKKTNWEKEKNRIRGAGDLPDTLIFFQRELDYLDTNLHTELDSKYEERRDITRAIFDKKQDVISVYKESRDRLNQIIESNSETLQKFKIEVDASLVKRIDFEEKFLDYIDKGKMGSFYSKDGGESQIKGLATSVNFDKKDDIISFLDSIIMALRNDKRIVHNEADRVIADQVKDISELYSYLFSLNFLANNYQLKQGNKTLDQLSPGERGAMLLVFYLLLDNSDIPLIIDQPEDNLDNHSVATVLVPFIRVAKKNRQIIMITHNPNLAVVADAEQVIYVKLDKENNYTFSTISGSIEDKEINKKIVEVLEGDMPAFNTRKRKYYE